MLKKDISLDNGQPPCAFGKVGPHLQRAGLKRPVYRQAVRSSVPVG